MGVAKLVGLDVEGPLVNPASDFAWLTYDELLSESTKAEFPRKRCENYDGKYDDGRYLYNSEEVLDIPRVCGHYYLYH